MPLNHLFFNANEESIKQPKDNVNPLENQIVAMSRSLARARVNWTPEQKKLFVMCLTQIKWSKDGNSNIIHLSKKDIAKTLKLNFDSTDLSKYLRQAFQKLSYNSEIHFSDPDKQTWTDGFLIIRRTSTRNQMEVAFNPEFMPLLENLVKQSNYLTVWSNDIYGFQSRFSFELFEELRLHWDDRYQYNFRTYSTEQLKDIFGLGKGEYVRKDGFFNRRNFEIKTLDRAIREINKSEMMMIYPQTLNKKDEPVFYKKLKKGGYVTGYQIKYKCFIHTQSPTDQPHEKTRGEMVADDTWEAEQMQMQMEDGVWHEM